MLQHRQDGMNILEWVNSLGIFFCFHEASFKFHMTDTVPERLERISGYITKASCKESFQGSSSNQLIFLRSLKRPS